MQNNAAIRPVIFIPCQNNILPVWQWLSNAFKCLSSHDNRLSKGQFPESFHVCRQFPRQRVIFSNHSISAHCCYEGDYHLKQPFPLLSQGEIHSFQALCPPL